MAQGIKITSNNLNGKNGEITFLPASGGTINLGTQLLPYTYATAYPYGEYQINVSDYNYTYSLVVPAPAPLQTAYTETVRISYPNAVLSSQWSITTDAFITSKGYSPNTIVYAEGICADDVDAPKYFGVDNIGQFPTGMNSFLGPFMSGGLAGYPFVGTVGFGAWASHVASTSGGTLFMSSMPHIGISQLGEVGRMFRRGKTGSTTDNTCGAVAGAIGVTVAATSAPNIGDWSDNYQFYKLLDILYPYQSILTGITYGDQMLSATTIIRDAATTFITDNLPAATTASTSNDVFFCSGTFINTDDGYESYVDINEFKRFVYSSQTWVDMTSEYLSQLLA
jgi:hypothetical protein